MVWSQRLNTVSCLHVIKHFVSLVQISGKCLPGCPMDGNEIWWERRRKRAFIYILYIYKEGRSLPTHHTTTQPPIITLDIMPISSLQHYNIKHTLQQAMKPLTLTLSLSKSPRKLNDAKFMHSLPFTVMLWVGGLETQKLNMQLFSNNHHSLVR